MDVYKGTGAFSGIAIGKILYYHKSEYQMRQYEITDVKTELNIFAFMIIQIGRAHV